jgi:hypothetical protein
MVQSKLKQAIFEKLAEVEALLLEASCEGAQLAELDCFEEVDTALAHLTEQVGYYVD